MSDRLAVMSKGKIMQLGAPREIYQFPRSEFVADFLGVANLMDVQVDERQRRRGPRSSSATSPSTPRSPRATRLAPVAR